MSENGAALVYPHQLFDSSPISDGQRIYLVEDPLFFGQYAFHRQKLMLHRASMKWYASRIASKSNQVHYVEYSELASTADIAKRLKSDGIQSARLVDPDDDWLARDLRLGCREHGIQLEFLPHPHFLTSAEAIESFVGTKRKLFFTQFYIEQRKRLKCLLDQQGSPLGGKWSFDTENRKKLPKGTRLPMVDFPVADAFAKEARRYVETSFPVAPGVARDLLYPSNRNEALRWLDRFLDERLSSFGDFEDAIVPDEAFLFHSCLTSMLNIGLISPQDILDRTLANIERVPLNSLEGFLRQVIGWREFVRAVYRTRGAKQRTTNYWRHTRKIPESFYTGTTGIEPVDTVIRRVLELGYCHHIERLMILGNFMLLCEFDPDAVYRWFMELFIDAYDWVMVPNVYGMSQYADGGFMTTKPYISGSSYVLRMSGFPKGPWCETWDALYWRFMAKHRDFFENNPRMRVMTMQLDKMGKKLDLHMLRANTYLEALH